MTESTSTQPVTDRPDDGLDSSSKQPEVPRDVEPFPRQYVFSDSSYYIQPVAREPKTVYMQPVAPEPATVREYVLYRNDSYTPPCQYAPAARISRLSELPQDELVQMEKTAERKKPENDELSKTRMARDKAIREQRRAMKAAYKANAAATIPGPTTLAYQQPSMTSSTLPTHDPSTSTNQQDSCSQSSTTSTVKPVDGVYYSEPAHQNKSRR